MSDGDRDAYRDYCNFFQSQIPPSLVNMNTPNQYQNQNQAMSFPYAAWYNYYTAWYMQAYQAMADPSAASTVPAMPTPQLDSNELNLLNPNLAIPSPTTSLNQTLFSKTDSLDTMERRPELHGLPCSTVIESHCENANVMKKIRDDYKRRYPHRKKPRGFATQNLNKLQDSTSSLAKWKSVIESAKNGGKSNTQSSKTKSKQTCKTPSVLQPQTNTTFSNTNPRKRKLEMTSSSFCNTVEKKRKLNDNKQRNEIKSKHEIHSQETFPLPPETDLAGNEILCESPTRLKKKIIVSQRSPDEDLLLPLGPDLNTSDTFSSPIPSPVASPIPSPVASPTKASFGSDPFDLDFGSFSRTSLTLNLDEDSDFLIQQPTSPILPDT